MVGRRQGNICSVNVGRRVGVLSLLNRQQRPLTVNLPVRSDLRRVKGVGGAFVYSNWRAIMHCWCWTTKSRHSSPAGLFSAAESFCINQTSHPCSTDRTVSLRKRTRTASLASDAADASFLSSSQRGREPAGYRLRSAQVPASCNPLKHPYEKDAANQVLRAPEEHR
jgi:hypothetical protein